MASTPGLLVLVVQCAHVCDAGLRRRRRIAWWLWEVGEIRGFYSYCRLGREIVGVVGSQYVMVRGQTSSQDAGGMLGRGPNGIDGGRRSVVTGSEDRQRGRGALCSRKASMQVASQENEERNHRKKQWSM